jgi:hypothetical protein
LLCEKAKKHQVHPEKDRDAMTPEEYLSKERFPRSSQPGLTLNQQMMIDAVNLDDLLNADSELNAKEQAILAELTQKKAAWPSLKANSHP